MKKKNTLYKFTMLLLGIGLITTSCVRPDRSDCYDFKLWVRFDPDMYELPFNEHRIESVHVYVFDENDKFITYWSGGPYNYSNGADLPVPIDLEPGKYRFIAWTNSGDDYLLNYQEDQIVTKNTGLEELELYLIPVDDDRNFYNDITDLHYGILDNAVVDPSQPSEYVIYLIPDTYRINVTVRGIRDDHTFGFSIKDNNAHYDFENSVVPEYDDIQHIRTSGLDDNRITASMRILSMTDDHDIRNIGRPGDADRSPQFTFLDTQTGRNYYTGDLVEMIRTAYRRNKQEVDFDKTYEFDIVLDYGAGMNLTITVNGWYYNPIEVEL